MEDAGHEVRVAALKPQLAGQDFAIRDAKTLFKGGGAWSKETSGVNAIWERWLQLWRESAPERELRADIFNRMSAFDEQLQEGNALTASGERKEKKERVGCFVAQG